VGKVVFELGHCSDFFQILPQMQTHLADQVHRAGKERLGPLFRLSGEANIASGNQRRMGLETKFRSVKRSRTALWQGLEIHAESRPVQWETPTKVDLQTGH
jgi:hypothetical protein